MFVLHHTICRRKHYVFDLSIFLHMRAYVLAKAFCERLAVDFKLCLYLILNISCLLALSYRVYSKYS